MEKNLNNIKINSKLKRVEINLAKEIYSVEMVKCAVEDFKGVCKGSLKEGDNIFVLLELDDKEGLKKIGYEFCNYVLGLMKNEALV
jgi:hypothetical protein